MTGCESRCKFTVRRGRPNFWLVWVIHTSPFTSSLNRYEFPSGAAAHAWIRTVLTKH